MWLAVIFVSRVIDDDVLTNAFVIIVLECIVHVTKYVAQWVFIEVTVGIAISIHEGTFLYIEPEVAAYYDIRWALYEWRDLVLYLCFNHAVVAVAGSIRYFQLNHDRAGSNVAACKWHAWTMYSTTVAAVHRRNTTWDVIYTCSFCGPVEVNAAIHTTYAESYRSAVVIRTIIKYVSRNQCDSIRSIVGQRHDCVLIAVSNRYHIVYNADGKAARRMVTALVGYMPGNSMVTQWELVDNVVVTEVNNMTSRSCQAQGISRTASIVNGWFRNANVSIAIPEVSTYFEVSWASQFRSLIVRQLDDLYAFYSSLCTPVKNGPGTNDLLAVTAVIQWFIPVANEDVTYVVFICDWVTVNGRPASVFRI